MDGLYALANQGGIVLDSEGNHTFCNTHHDNYLVFTFGNVKWTNYAVELRVKELDYDKGSNPHFAIYARYNLEINIGYLGALNFQTNNAELSINQPYISLGHQTFPTTADTWYTLRLEVAGKQISYYINNQLIGLGTDSNRSQGRAGFSISPSSKVCIDDIRVWALTENGAIGQAPPTSSSLEIVTDKAATGNGGNPWGGHQTRIVRTADGVFTAYIIAGNNDFNRKWQLARRQEDGTWPVIAEGGAGMQPVNLLASPDGTLHIIGWPDGIGTMWSGKPEGDHMTMTKEIIQGVSQGYYSYNSAGIDQNGDLCVFSSTGNIGGTFMWACLLQSQGKWISFTSQLDYRYCYTYVFPESGDQLSLISTRDVSWDALGYVKPEGEIGALFNAIGYWRTNDISSEPLQRIYSLEQKATSGFPDPYLDAEQDAYLDTAGNMHIIARRGSYGQGSAKTYQIILSPDGTVLNTMQLPRELGGFSRIFQDAQGHFYILGSSGL